jgi:hypothetical protein
MTPRHLHPSAARLARKRAPCGAMRFAQHGGAMYLISIARGSGWAISCDGVVHRVSTRMHSIPFGRIPRNG